MKKKELKEELLLLLNQDVVGLTQIEKINLIRDFLLEAEKEVGHNEKNKGKEWADDELRIVLSFSPNKENCLRLAKAFNRGYGSIEQIFRWAATSEKSIENKGRNEDRFVNQVKRIAKECGWRI